MHADHVEYYFLSCLLSAAYFFQQGTAERLAGSEHDF